MKKANWIALFLVTVFGLCVAGCDAPPQQVDKTKQTGLSTQDRKDKRGDL